MQIATLQNARILIVDDQELNVRFLECVLQRAGYRCLKSTTDARAVLPLYAEFQPDLILLDLHMPYLDGFAVMEQLAALIPEGTYLPILVLTADITPEAKQRALRMGAKDFLTKPFDGSEVLLRIGNLVETRFLHRQLQNQNQILEEKVRERTRELEDARMEILERLALAAEYRDDATGQHTRRVGQLSAALARAVGLPEPRAALIGRAAPLHDVGKIGIPDRILLKPDSLTAAEFERMQMHVIIGARILSGSRFPLLRMAEQIALSHHAHWDGTGYPPWMAGELIPLAGRIVAVADVFDVLTHERPYKEAWTEAKAIAEIESQSDRQFDPRVVGAFLRLVNGARASTAMRESDWHADARHADD
ncbi:MAG: response regulator [Armatimonadetes bacterium]|nr:response regulator [Armatimonadota bacterium]